MPQRLKVLVGRGERHNIIRWAHVVIGERSLMQKANRREAKSPRKGLGNTGEHLATEKLVSCGYRIVEHNFSCRLGEIDIVAEDGDDLVFVEVKTRRGDAYGLPEEAITIRKQRKLIELAFYYLDLHSCVERSWRIDVVAVQLSVKGRLEEIRIYQHAVSE
jgi:putative endonuclease